MELATDIDSDAYEEDSSEEDNEEEAELQEEQEEPSDGEKSDWGLHNMQEVAGMSTDLLNMRKPQQKRGSDHQ
jgi:hypothetical protein